MIKIQSYVVRTQQEPIQAGMTSSGTALYRSGLMENLIEFTCDAQDKSSCPWGAGQYFDQLILQCEDQYLLLKDVTIDFIRVSTASTKIEAEFRDIALYDNKADLSKELL